MGQWYQRRDMGEGEKRVAAMSAAVTVITQPLRARATGMKSGGLRLHSGRKGSVVESGGGGVWTEGGQDMGGTMGARTFRRRDVSVCASSGAGALQFPSFSDGMRFRGQYCTLPGQGTFDGIRGFFHRLQSRDMVHHITEAKTHSSTEAGDWDCEDEFCVDNSDLEWLGRFTDDTSAESGWFSYWKYQGIK